MVFNIQEDFINPTEKAIQKMLSYKELIPSSDFNEDEYNLYLQYASSEELEKDIVSEKTYRKIFPEEYTNFSEARLRNL